MKKISDILVTCGKALTIALPMIALASCTPHFNREGQQPAAGPQTFANPILDLTAQGGASAPGVTPHFKVTRVAIGGNIQRIRATTPSKSLLGGPHAPH